jgi:SAM-dependent methyltransferase
MPPTRHAALPDCVPPAWLDAIDAVARGTLGRAELPQAALIPEIAQLSAAYTRDRGTARTLAEAPRTAGALAARLRFFLPRDLAKIGGPLEELRLAGALPRAVVEGARRARVLDVGAGLGATCLGAATYFKTHGLAQAGLEVDALDSDARALTVLTALAKETQGGRLAEVTVPTEVRAQTLDVTNDAALPRTRYDLIFVGFALNELFATLPPADAVTRRAAWLVALSERLADDGALVVLEPALRDTSRALQAVRDVLAARAEGPFVAAPCVRTGPCPMLLGERDWCHASLPLALPGRIAELARGAGLRFEGLRYAYLVLRRQPDAMAARLREGRGAALRVVGDPLASKGKVELFACGEPGLVRLMRLEREASEANADFGDGTRGALLSVEPLALRAVSPEDKAGVARARLTTETRVQRL